MNCPECGSEMSRCEKGHSVIRGLPGLGTLGRAERYTGRTEKEPHWRYTDGSHGAISVFDDGGIEEI